MKKTVQVGVLICMAFSMSFGIGLQHGLFRSQSTQGEQWMGTAEIVTEHFDITVYPDYLDVEMTWEFEAGGTEPDSFANALEVVGNLNLEDNATVVSMLVWYKDMILKGKLKENGTARSEYEDVVERDSDAPPPPRDPVLLEMIRDDNYDISIFPIEFGGKRKVRIRYLIPGKTVGGEMRIGYPHAFTENATVAVKKGAGVASYRLVTADIIQPIFYNEDFELLPKADYCFKPYGHGKGTSITAIVPELTETVTGTRMYYGDFSATESFSGTMAHISAPSGSDIMLKTTAKEDYVVIWRWNSANILRLYTQQVRHQAETLISFFSALNASSKRGALIISKMGGESKTFALDKNGGEIFNEMIAYLNKLAELALPPMDNITSSSISKDETREIAEKSFEEFKAALQAAVDMVKESDAKKYVLILTAGPYSSTSYDKKVEGISEDITLSLFSQFYQGGTGLGYNAWPGVALRDIVVPVEQTAIKVFAYITNGTEVDSFQTNGYYSAASDRFIYSDQPIEQELTWKLFLNDELLTEFTETMSRLPVDDPMQYARLVGSQKSMRPLAETMPTSLASTLGFVDMKYTLLALEQDALAPEVASQYEENGVPLLTSADIYPTDDEQDAIPVAEWLEANPREDNGSYLTRGGWILDDMEVMFEAVPEANKDGGAAQWANPQAEVIEVQSPEIVADVLEMAPVVAEKVTTATNRISLHVQHGYLTIDFGKLTSVLSGRAELVVYDVKGRVVMRWKLDRFLTIGAGTIRLQLSGIRSGMYIVRLEKGTVGFSQSIMIR